MAGEYAGIIDKKSDEGSYQFEFSRPDCIGVLRELQEAGYQISPLNSSDVNIQKYEIKRRGEQVGEMDLNFKGDYFSKGIIDIVVSKPGAKLKRRLSKLEEDF